MDLPLSAVAGTLRLALQVVSNRRRPVLEIYATFRHRARLPEVYKTRDREGKVEEHHIQGYDVFVDFVLANIGGLRAENIKLKLNGDFMLFTGLKKLSSIAVFRGATIPQMAPAQQFPMFHIDSFELEAHGADGKSIGMTKERFAIQAEYNGPRSFLGRIRRRKYTLAFEFGADIFEGALIPPHE